MECNFCNYTIRWQMSKSINVPTHFCASSYSLRAIKMPNVKVMECNFSQLNYSMVNVKICKCIPYIVCARSYSFRNIKLKMFTLKK